MAAMLGRPEGMQALTSQVNKHGAKGQQGEHSIVLLPPVLSSPVLSCLVSYLVLSRLVSSCFDQQHKNRRPKEKKHASLKAFTFCPPTPIPPYTYYCTYSVLYGNSHNIHQV